MGRWRLRRYAPAHNAPTELRNYRYTFTETKYPIDLLSTLTLIRQVGKKNILANAKINVIVKVVPITSSDYVSVILDFCDIKE